MYTPIKNFRTIAFIFLISFLPIILEAQENPKFRKLSVELEIVQVEGDQVDKAKVFRLFLERLEEYTYKSESEEEWRIRYQVWDKEQDINKQYSSDLIDHIGRFNFLEDVITFKLDSLHNNAMIVYATTARTDNLEEDIKNLAVQTKDDINEFFFGAKPGRRSNIYVSSGDKRINSIAGFKVEKRKITQLSLLRAENYRYLTATTGNNVAEKLSMSSEIKAGSRYRYWRLQPSKHIFTPQKWRGGVGLLVAPDMSVNSFTFELTLERFLTPAFFWRAGAQHQSIGVRQVLEPIPGDEAESFVQRRTSLGGFLGVGSDVFFDDGLISLSFTADALICNRGFRGLFHLRMNKYVRFALSGGWQSLSTLEAKDFQATSVQAATKENKLRAKGFVGGISVFETF